MLLRARPALAGFTLLCSAALYCSADTLTLRNGRVVNGSYLGGDSRQIRMAVGDRIETFPIEQTSGLQFGSAEAAPAASALPAEPPVPAAAEKPSGRLLRPERDYDARSEARPSVSGVEIPSGTQVIVRMIDTVDSERDRLGQTFRASVDEPVAAGGRTVIPRGADAILKLVDDRQAGKIEGRTVLTLAIMQVQVDGRLVDVTTGDVSQASNSRGARSAKVIGGTTALGAVIGAIAGGGKGAAIGAASGAAVGTGAEVMTKGQRVNIPSETRLTFTLQQPVRL